METIPTFPKYQIDKFGNIYSTISNKILKPFIAKDGVLKVALTDEKGKRKGVLIHRLVAITYIDNPEGKPQVDHIDGNKHNNHVSNLRWCTNEENQLFREAQNNTGKEGLGKSVQWGDEVYPSIKSLAKLIATQRGSKVDTIKKELKAARYQDKVLYGKLVKFL